MRYQVPQFIEVEDKIFGPFTFRQFAYLAGGAGVSFLCYKLLPTFIGIIVAVPFVAFAFALAFYKVNNRPLIDAIEAGFEYITKSRLYIWKKVEKKATSQKEADEKMATDALASLYVPKLSDSKLKDLGWSLDINETIYSRDKGLSKGSTIPNNRPF